MKLKPESPAEFWAPSVWTWFRNELARNDLAVDDKIRLRRLSNDLRMKYVAETLERHTRQPTRLSKKAQALFNQRPQRHNDWAEASVGDDDITDPKPDRDIQFITRAWQLPNIWHFVKTNAPEVRAARLRKLAAACKSFKVALENERNCVEFLTSISPHMGFEAGKASYANLFEAVNKLSVAIKYGGRAWCHDDVIPVLPRAMQSRTAPEIFAIRNLIGLGRELFAKPMYKAAAITAAVSLDLKRISTEARAKELFESQRELVGNK